MHLSALSASFNSLILVVVRMGLFLLAPFLVLLAVDETMPGGEMVSHCPLEARFEVRVLAGQVYLLINDILRQSKPALIH